MNRQTTLRGRRGLSFSMVGVVLLFLGCTMTVATTLVSNRPDTTFLVRKPRLEDLPDEGWKEVGKGGRVTVLLDFDRVEIAARAPGYRQKTVRLTEPVETQEFRFLQADALKTPTPKVARDSDPKPPGMAPVSGHKHALIIGITTYRDSSFKTLRNARRDAEAIANFLKSPTGGNIPSTRVHLLVDDKATRAEILKQLVGMAAEANPGDLIFIYFAGHGQVQGGKGQARFLMPFDAEMTNPIGTAIEQSNLVGHLDDEEVAHRQILLLDCCFAGPVVRGSEDDVWDGLASRGRVVMTSTKGNETALDGDRRSENSPFAAAVLSALKGELPADHDDNGRITMKELFDAVSPRVRRAARDAGHKMTPRLYGDAAAEIEILAR